jgi:hypothetical protein
MFNISEFKARMDKYSGPARTNLFVVELSPINIPDVVTTDDLRFFCQSIVIPGINIETMPYKPAGMGYTEYMPMNIQPENMNAIFLLDNEGKILTFFHRWMNSIINNDGNAGSNSSLERHEINYKNEYSTTLTIKHFSAHDTTKYYEYVYNGVYPTEIGSKTMNWGSGDIATISVNFSYNRISYMGVRQNSPEASRMFRGLDSFTIENRNIPQILTQADVNRFTNFTI